MNVGDGLLLRRGGWREKFLDGDEKYGDLPVALVYSEGPWSNYVLAYQLMSFAGNRERGSVNQTYIEPEISYSFESGWSVDCDPAITYDWTADTANAWIIPMGADIGKAFKLGS